AARPFRLRPGGNAKEPLKPGFHQPVCRHSRRLKRTPDGRRSAPVHMLYHPSGRRGWRMDGETCMRKAYEAIFQGNFEAAVAWFLQALEREPGNADYHYKSSITIARSGRLDLALRLA